MTENGNGLRGSYLEDANQASHFVKKASGSSRSKYLKKSALEQEEQKDEKIEAARFEFFMFKQTMYDLFDHLKGNHSCLQAPGKSPMQQDQDFLTKVGEVESRLDKVDGHFEYLAAEAEKSQKLN